MSPILATALGVAVLAGVATWLFVATGLLLLWAAFVAWGCFFHLGGDRLAFVTQIRCNTFGSLVGTLCGAAILCMPNIPGLHGPVWAGLCVAIAVVVYICASQNKLLGSIPAITYGFACTFAYLTQNPNIFTLRAITSFSLNNAFITVSLSMMIGAGFAFTSAWLSVFITGRAEIPRVSV